MTHEETLFKMVSEMSGKLGGIAEGLADVKDTQKEFRVLIMQLFEKHAHCPGPHAAQAIADLRDEFDQHLDRTTTTRNKASDDKISRPPKPPALSERTVQIALLVVLALMAAAGITIPMVTP